MTNARQSSVQVGVYKSLRSVDQLHLARLSTYLLIQRDARAHVWEGARHGRERLHRCLGHKRSPRARLCRARHRPLGKQGRVPPRILQGLRRQARDRHC